MISSLRHVVAVGLGNMGGAVLKAVLAASIIPADRIGVCDALEDRDVRADTSPDDPTIAQFAQNASVVVLERVLWSPRA